jgi:hypothetical protein
MTYAQPGQEGSVVSFKSRSGIETASLKVCAPGNDFTDLAPNIAAGEGGILRQEPAGQGAESPLNNAKGEQTANMYICIRLYIRA